MVKVLTNHISALRPVAVVESDEPMIQKQTLHQQSFYVRYVGRSGQSGFVDLLGVSRPSFSRPVWFALRLVAEPPV